MIAYVVGNSGQTLILTDAVVAHFARYRQLTATSREAGGQLFARIIGNNILVERATGPRPSDRRSVFFFIPDRIAERREINGLFKAGLHYIGDWHTHPESQPQPSKTDTWSFRDMFRKSRHQLAGFVMVIVGTAAASAGLFVGVSDGEKLQKLTPLEP